MKRRRAPPKNVWCCKRCDIIFRDKRRLCTHNKSAHSSETRHAFKLCDAKFLSNNNLDEDLKRYKRTKFTCATCGQVFDGAYKYSLHLHEYDNSEGYICPLCNFTTLNKISIGAHIHRAHLQRFKLACKHCGKRFNNAVQRMEHEEGHLDDDSEFVCVVCKRRFSEKDKLTMHQIYYHKVPVKPKGRSKVCYVKDPTSKTGTRTRCSTCGKYVIRLNVHMKVHEKYRPYECSICKKTFNRSADLKVHERVHTGERPYVCKICGERFKYVKGFHLHVRKHTGEKPFKCYWCDEGFVSKEKLKYHLKSCSA